MLAFRDKPGRRRRSARNLAPPTCSRVPSAAPAIACASPRSWSRASRGIPSGRNATTASWKTSSHPGRNRPKHRAGAAHHAHTAGRKDHRPEADGKSAGLRFLSARQKLLPAAKISNTRLQMFEQAIQLDSEFCSGARRHREPLRADLRNSRAKPEVDRPRDSRRATAPPRSRPICRRCWWRTRASFTRRRNTTKAALLAQRAIERKPDCEGVVEHSRPRLFRFRPFEEAAAFVERAIEANGDDYNTYIPYDSRWSG